MSKIFQQEAINTPDESLPKRALRSLGRMASGVVAPLDKHKPTEAISFFDAPEPVLPLADELDRLDAPYDDKMIADKMAHIIVCKTED